MFLTNQARKYLENFPTFKQLIKFCIVGGTAAVISFSILVILTEWLGFWYVISAMISFIVSATFNFLANKFWTFRHPAVGRQALFQFFKFLSVTVSGLTINTLIIYGLTDHFGLDYRLSWVGATGVVTFWNYSFNRFWTFRHHEEKQL